jgi:hypothetical protein
MLAEGSCLEHFAAALTIVFGFNFFANYKNTYKKNKSVRSIDSVIEFNFAHGHVAGTSIFEEVFYQGLMLQKGNC